MKKNMSNIDRIIRASLAVLVAVLYFANVISGTWAVILGLIAVVFLLTSVVSFCPLYAALKISTHK